MKKNLFFLFCTLLVFTSPLFSQSLTGEWTGELTQDNKPGVFNYTVYLVQDGSQVSGTAKSRNAANTQNASFEVAGQWDGKNLMLQEVKQLTPENGNWCLKHIRLAMSVNGSAATLSGPWEAQGCTPGQLSLKRAGAGSEVAVSKAVIPADVSGSPFKGKWVGHLDQSDRNYGFYFEVKFNTDGTGTSYIQSDGTEGNASFSFKWKYNPDRALLSIQESTVLEKSVATWKWCIKTCNLFYKVEENRLALSGDWGGHIEGFTPKTGPCAEGTLYLEQPVFRQGELSETASADGLVPTPVAAEGYRQAQGREVDVERILEVKSKTVRIRVWDNGTVDGDVCTLFLNGEMILKNYRVTRIKNETTVTLQQPVNYIILHANSLGSISPNTIAVSVDDGVQEQTVIVSSNLKTSGAIMIREFTVK